MSTVIRVENLDLFYGDFQALKKVSMDVLARHITALIGPSGCGKSTLLRTLNRMNDLVPGVKITGSILFDGKEIYAPGIDVCTLRKRIGMVFQRGKSTLQRTLSRMNDLVPGVKITGPILFDGKENYAPGIDVCTLRKRIGMVFQRPNPFPLSVFDNVAFGLRVEGRSSRQQIQEIVERSLKRAWLWEPLKDKLNDSALSLPLDQQQRLCIARLLAVEPEVILMDEPCSALDPISTSKIEELMLELKKDYTIVIVTHNMQQAARISDFSGYMLLGQMIEFDVTDKIFTNPRDGRTQDYISGRYG